MAQHPPRVIGSRPRSLNGPTLDNLGQDLVVVRIAQYFQILAVHFASLGRAKRRSCSLRRRFSRAKAAAIVTASVRASSRRGLPSERRRASSRFWTEPFVLPTSAEIGARQPKLLLHPLEIDALVPVAERLLSRVLNGGSAAHRLISAFDDRHWDALHTGEVGSAHPAMAEGDLQPIAGMSRIVPGLNVAHETEFADRLDERADGLVVNGEAWLDRIC